jgi:hypothetical protein
MYAAGGQQPGANPEGNAGGAQNETSGAGGNEATDVEYEEVKDKK